MLLLMSAFCFSCALNRCGSLTFVFWVVDARIGCWSGVVVLGFFHLSPLVFPGSGSGYVVDAPCTMPCCVVSSLSVEFCFSVFSFSPYPVVVSLSGSQLVGLFRCCFWAYYSLSTLVSLRISLSTRGPSFLTRRATGLVVYVVALLHIFVHIFLASSYLWRCDVPGIRLAD